jgi:hypothetical protein
MDAPAAAAMGGEGKTALLTVLAVPHETPGKGVTR